MICNPLRSTTIDGKQTATAVGAPDTVFKIAMQPFSLGAKPRGLAATLSKINKAMHKQPVIKPVSKSPASTPGGIRKSSARAKGSIKVRLFDARPDDVHTNKTAGGGGNAPSTDKKSDVSRNKAAGKASASTLEPSIDLDYTACFAEFLNEFFECNETVPTD